MSLQQANELIESPTAQKLIDNANSGNINVLQNVGDKVVRITLDPTGSRIISAGLYAVPKRRKWNRFWAIHNCEVR
jgi:hypothetical protein